MLNRLMLERDRNEWLLLYPDEPQHVLVPGNVSLLFDGTIAEGRAAHLYPHHK
jgi:hypothetical protein